MNVYQSNFNPYYHGQPNHLLISPSSASSIYSNQSLGDENFYTNIDNSNHSLIHMFIKNESKPDQKSLEPYPNCSSAFTSFSSPSPSSSYNSSNGSGQMVTNWTPNSQTGQEEPVVLCQLDELTKNLNNNQMNCKKSKLIGPSLDAAYSQQKGELDPTMPVSYEPNVFNGHCLSSSEQQFLIQQQFNADLIHQQFAMQQPSLQPTAGDRTTHHIQQPLPPNHSSLSSQIPNVKPSLPPLTANAVSVGKVNTPIGPPMDQSIILNPLPAQQASAGAQSYQPNRLSLANCRLKQEQAAGNHLLNAIISYDSEGRPTANKKERRRTLSINNAFTNLRDCIPNVPSDTKLSKIKTLRLATSYISYLMGLLDDSAPMNGKRNRMMMTCEDFKVDLQRFKGRNKNIHLIYPTKFAVSVHISSYLKERLMVAGVDLVLGLVVDLVWI